MLLHGMNSHGCMAVFPVWLRKLLTKGGVICHGLLRGEAWLAAWRTMLGEALGEAERRPGD